MSVSFSRNLNHHTVLCEFDGIEVQLFLVKVIDIEASKSIKIIKINEHVVIVLSDTIHNDSVQIERN